MFLAGSFYTNTPDSLEISLVSPESYKNHEISVEGGSYAEGSYTLDVISTSFHYSQLV